MLLHLLNAASYLGALRKDGLSVQPNGLGETCGEGITPVILVAGERLLDGCSDRRPFRQGDELEWLHRIGGIGGGRVRRCFGRSAASRSCMRGLAASYHPGLVRAACHSQEVKSRGRNRYL